MAAKKTAARKASPSKAKRDERAAEKAKEDGVDTIAGAVDVTIEPAHSEAPTEDLVPYAESDKGKEQAQAVIDRGNQKEEDKEPTVVNTVAQLRDAAATQGKTVTTEQVAAAREAERVTEEEGKDEYRVSAQAASEA